MKKFETFNEALTWQKSESTGYNYGISLETEIDVIDRVQFALGEVFWVCISEGYYLDDYEEYVTQYGVTHSGEWAAVSGGHCSCYGWEQMDEKDITYYPTLEVLLKADPNANVISKHLEILKEALKFL
jgi:hypothetical protein